MLIVQQISTLILISLLGRGYKEQLTDFIALVKANIKKETQLLLAPETALLEGLWENKIDATYSVRALKDLQNEFPKFEYLDWSNYV